jgi:hypothetical protein
VVQGKEGRLPTLCPLITLKFHPTYSACITQIQTVVIKKKSEEEIITQISPNQISK